MLDVGKEEEGSGPDVFNSGAKGDVTALMIVEVVTSGRNLPEYRVVDHGAWTGTKHTALLGQFVDLARNDWGFGPW